MTVSIYVEGWGDDPEITENSPEFNSTTSTLQMIFAMLGIGHLDSNDGELPAAAVSGVQRAALKALNDPRSIERHAYPQDLNGRPWMGNASDESLRIRLNNLAGLLAYAQRRGKGIYWA